MTSIQVTLDLWGGIRDLWRVTVSFDYGPVAILLHRPVTPIQLKFDLYTGQA
jgi:hypothetical protein